MGRGGGGGGGGGGGAGGCKPGTARLAFSCWRPPAAAAGQASRAPCVLQTRPCGCPVLTGPKRVCCSDCQSMGLEAGTEGVVTGAELNEATYQEALAAAPQLFKETLHTRGKQLKFHLDRCAGFLPSFTLPPPFETAAMSTVPSKGWMQPGWRLQHNAVPTSQSCVPHAGLMHPVARTHAWLVMFLQRREQGDRDACGLDHDAP